MTKIEILLWLALVLGLVFVVMTYSKVEKGASKPANEVADTEHVIRIAAERNGIEYGSENWYILLGIWHAEGIDSNYPFGIMTSKADTFDKKAGWCAASIVKARVRWKKAGKQEDFITFMGRRYCPSNNHPLNKNWVKNVKYWKNKLEVK